jgi:hypothetical protein
VVRNDDYALRTFHHGANRLDHKRAGVAEAIASNAADSKDSHVGRNAVEHSFADWAKLNAEVRIEVSTGQSDFGLPALPKNLRHWDRVCDDLNWAAKKASGYFRNGRTAAQDDGLPILNQIRGSPPYLYFFFLATYRKPLEVERLLARRRRHRAPVYAPNVAAAFQLDQIAANRCPGSIESGAQILEADEVLP